MRGAFSRDHLCSKFRILVNIYELFVACVSVKFGTRDGLCVCVCARRDICSPSLLVEYRACDALLMLSHTLLHVASQQISHHIPVVTLGI